MKMKLGNEGIKENLGDVMMLGCEVRHPYDNDKKETNTKLIETVTVNLACTALSNSIAIVFRTTKDDNGNDIRPEIPNVKNWGKVKLVGLVYDPSATASSFEDRDTGKSRSYGSLNERFTATRIEPLTPADRKADENGEVMSTTAAEKPENKDNKK